MGASEARTAGFAVRVFTVSYYLRPARAAMVTSRMAVLAMRQPAGQFPHYRYLLNSFRPAASFSKALQISLSLSALNCLNARSNLALPNSATLVNGY